MTARAVALLIAEVGGAYLVSIGIKVRKGAGFVADEPVARA